jgi:O-methyltransferase
MRFIAFDSFEGFPELQGIDKDTRDFSRGQYAAGMDEVRQNLVRDRVVFVPGWFDQACTPATREKHNIRKAAVIWVDYDLYHSMKRVLNFVMPMLQDGTVIVFDDWYSFRGNPRRGE